MIRRNSDLIALFSRIIRWFRISTGSPGQCRNNLWRIRYLPRSRIVWMVRNLWIIEHEKSLKFFPTFFCLFRVHHWIESFKYCQWIVQLSRANNIWFGLGSFACMSCIAYLFGLNLILAVTIRLHLAVNVLVSFFVLVINIKSIFSYLVFDLVRLFVLSSKLYLFGIKEMWCHNSCRNHLYGWQLMRNYINNQNDSLSLCRRLNGNLIK